MSQRSLHMPIEQHLSCMYTSILSSEISIAVCILCVQFHVNLCKTLALPCAWWVGLRTMGAGLCQVVWYRLQLQVQRRLLHWQRLEIHTDTNSLKQNVTQAQVFKCQVQVLKRSWLLSFSGQVAVDTHRWGRTNLLHVLNLIVWHWEREKERETQLETEENRMIRGRAPRDRWKYKIDKESEK